MATGWTQRLASAPHALAIAGTVLALAALGQAAAQATMVTAVHAGHTAPGRTPGDAVSLCLLALAVTVPLIFLRPAAAAAAITAASTVSLAVFGSGALTVAGLAAQVIASYRLGYQGVSGDAGLALAGADRRDPTPVLACGLAVPFLVLALDGRARVPAILLVALVPAAAWAGIAQRARGEAARQATAREVIAGTLADHMARGERARIARELHDVVAHYISMIAVQAETARETTPGLPAAGTQRLAEIAGTARAGLTEMRRLLGVLREDAGGAAARHPQPGLPQLAELIDAARETSGAGARLIVSGPVAAFDPSVELAAYRIVQEALTNARRHAPGTAVDVELRYGEGTLLLQVRDNGPGPPAGHPAGNGQNGAGSPGHGLTGMRERATAAGGSLRTATAPGGGFLVEATLPAKPELA
ncbi:MAG TPA: sensor histidine kinase [Streptosporangiaceae bacterium]|jgi:signal transduction histidine kinase|nr:sensor histidine kinase [Streptosporangiaceae bacterium]